MPAGRDPNETFANVGARSPQRIPFVPILLVALVVIGLGFLIAWGLNQFLRATFTARAAATAGSVETTPDAPPATAVRETLPASPPPGDVRVVSAQPTLPPTASRAVDPDLVPTSVAAGPVVTRPPSTGDVAVVAPDPRPSMPPSAVPAAEPTLAPAPRAFAALPSAPAAPAPAPAVDTNLRNPENALIKAEVLKRIDQMPDLSPENRDKLYSRVERTPGMGRVATIFFDTGESRVRATDVERLRLDLSSAAVQRLVDDPTVVLVVLGYADPIGGADANKALSQARATSAVAALRDRLKLTNVMHSVAMGSSTLFGEGRGQLQKNRVVEVWAVMP